MSVMIDWVSVKFQGPSGSDVFPIGSRFLHVSEDGVVDRVSPEWRPLRGSYESKIMFKPCGDFLLASGNPTKALQGHNLWGEYSLSELIVYEYELYAAQCGYAVPPLAELTVKPTRLDVTRSYRFSSQAKAGAWIQRHGGIARSPRGRSIAKGNTTFILNSGSTYWELVVYAKQPELLVHPVESLNFSDLFDWAGGVVRFEFRLGSRVLAKLGPVEDLDPVSIWNQFFDKCTGLTDVNLGDVDMSSSVVDRVMKMPGVSELSSGCRAAVRFWASEDYEALYEFPRATRYRYRNEFRKATGFDLFSECPVVYFYEDREELDAKGWDPPRLLREVPKVS